jgi:circadian clock protein KaiB
MQLVGPATHALCWRNGAPRHEIRGITCTDRGFLSKYSLRLFVTGASPRTGAAIANLRRICEEELVGQYDLEIIDVLEHPELAEDERILATPTLIKSLPPPLRRVIGDLSNKEKVLLGLEVLPKGGDGANTQRGTP